MVTSGVIYHFLRLLSINVDIRNICVFLAPVFSGLTSIAMYLLTSEMTPSPSAGLLAAAFMGIAPGYISRSVAGSYDNEAIAIFLLVFTFYLWIKAVKNGSIMWGALAALFYGYMVSAWGGYVFITNLIPLHAFVLICMGRYSSRLYISYTTWYALGTLASMQIPFVGFLPVRSSDHMAALGKSTDHNHESFSFLAVQSDEVLLMRKTKNKRHLWPAPACLLRGVPSCHDPWQTLPEVLDLRSPIHLRPSFPRTRSFNCHRRYCSLGRSLLFPLGYGIREDSYPHHRLSIRASANRLARFLLRSQHVDMALPGRCLHVFQRIEG